jgi:hypothetical protein
MDSALLTARLLGHSKPLEKPDLEPLKLSGPPRGSRGSRGSRGPGGARGRTGSLIRVVRRTVLVVLFIL